MGNQSGHFKSNLEVLCGNYIQMINYVNKRNYDEKNLQLITYKYLTGEGITYRDDHKDLEWVLYVHRLHPIIFNQSKKINHNWLINACLRQAQFCQKIAPHLKQYNYKKWIKQYKFFLHLCGKFPNKVIIPTLIEDFIWHAHMQDEHNYLTDIKNQIGKELDHDDEIPDQLLLKYKKERECLVNNIKYTDNQTSSCVTIMTTSWSHCGTSNDGCDGHGTSDCGGGCGSGCGGGGD